MRDYKKLEVWQKSYKLGLTIYLITKTFPKEEIYGLTSQVRRAKVKKPDLLFLKKYLRSQERLTLL